MRDEPAQRALRVVRGEPSATEIAALAAALAVVLARRPDPAAAPAARSGWLDRSALIGAPLRPGPGAWRRAGRPR
ncbi:MAG TPA: acyl-CoA carboxylase epsilon subunit [Streptosporangiaceae bacterium]|nr:acyl-CoA carboxylase epsilon subunit [Streptosporangiaceae bacterium]